MHRDLKLENIKFSSENKNNRIITILDFGFVYNLKGGGNELIKHQNYTLSYAAPEVCLNKKCTKSCDVWSLGGILYTLLSGMLPFNVDNEFNGDDGNKSSSSRQNSNVEQAIKFRIKHQLNNKLGLLKIKNKEAKKLIQNCLEAKPEDRIELSVKGVLKN